MAKKKPAKTFTNCFDQTFTVGKKKPARMPARKARRKARMWCINAPPTERDGLTNCEIIAGGRMYSWGRGVVVREVLPRKKARKPHD